MGKEIIIPYGKLNLRGNLVLPKNAGSFVIFSHGSGSSRFSPRNNFVARVLNKEGIATLMIDLLTPAEDQDYDMRFDINLLTKRLITVTQYMQNLPEIKNLKTGYFGASTGAASALWAASILNKNIHAVVSRGGRPDLASPVLRTVTAPVLLIVGGDDGQVITLNKEAYNRLECQKSIKIIPGATHLFEEPGKLEEVAQLALDWFKTNLMENKENKKGISFSKI